MARLTQFGGATLPIPLSPDTIQIDVLVVGGGGNYNVFAGGGGGRVIQSSGILVKKGQTYTSTVGSGGQDSSFSALTALRGGDGGISNLQVGGSGGAGGVYNGSPLPTYTSSAGAAIYPSSATYTASSVDNTIFISSSGNPGGNGSPPWGGGGGGGAGAAGGDSPGSNPPVAVPGQCRGGSGVLSAIKGTSNYYGAGGGGYNSYPIYTVIGVPGYGWGGANTGSGGAYPYPTNIPLSPQPTLGQSGVIIIAYKDTYPLATVTGAPLLFSASNPAGANATRSGYHVYEFTGSGTITFN